MSPALFGTEESVSSAINSEIILTCTSSVVGLIFSAWLEEDLWQNSILLPT